MNFTYAYPRAALTVDSVVFGFDDRALKVLLIRRGLEPFRGCWALPGGFVRTDETLDDAARRELREETGLAGIYQEQLHTFGDVGRDPRERVVSVAYVALVRSTDHAPAADTDAAEARWFRVDSLPQLAFDHAAILAHGIAHLRGKIRSQPLGFELLPEKFTLTQLQTLYEAVLDRELDKRNFRKRLLSFPILVPLDESTTEASRRPARLYRFDQRNYLQLTRQGFVFDL
jgi:8-oxo-dGTP diphosphatase